MPSHPGVSGRALIFRNLLISASLSLAYLLLSFVLIGHRPEQLVLVILFLVMFNSSTASRKFITGFSIFIFYWILFDYMKAFPNYRFHSVDIGGINDLERLLFGINTGGARLTPGEYFLAHQTRFLDVLCGLFYLCWIPVPLMMGIYLFFKKRKEFFSFALTFLLVNFIGFAIYYFHPAAPPWYFHTYGLQFIPGTPGNTAGLARFDQYFHSQIFRSIYAKSSNVFAAMPSLHSSYPAIVLFYGIKNKLGKINLLFLTITFGIWFAAVYTSHHYFLDVLVGILCAVVGIGLFQLVLLKTALVDNFITKMEKATS